MTFKTGDKVRANGREAEIVGWDEGSDRVSWLVIERGGSRNTYHGHISSTRLELVPLEDDPYPNDRDAGVAPTPLSETEDVTE